MVTSRRYSIATSNKFKGRIIGYRHLQCLLLFLGFCLLCASRVNLSIAIVAMMDSKSANPDFPEYSWSEQTKSHILSSFFCGYILLQVPSGDWARRFGGHLLLLLCISLNSVLLLLTPLAVSVGGWLLLCAFRLGQGLLQGVLLPAIATIMAKWAPVEERSTMLTFVYAGCQLGIVLMLGVSGKLCSSRWGWPSTFYLPGALGLIWSLLWFIYGANTPRDCKHISAEERAMIEKSLGHDKQCVNEKGETVLVVPWRRIFTSKPFLVLLLNHCANDWSFWLLLTQIPSYISKVLGKNINSNALLSALPYLSMFTLSLVLCSIATCLEKSGRLNITVSRKLFNTIGFWVSAATLVCLGYLRQDQGDLAIILLTATISINTTVHFGYGVNHLDLAPNIAGTLLGIANCGANLMGIVAPLTVGWIVTDTTNINQWRTVFSLSGGINFIGGLFFLIYGTAKVQPWNEQPSKLTEGEQLEELVSGTCKQSYANEENRAANEETLNDRC